MTNDNLAQNLFEEISNALWNLPKNKNLIIQKSDEKNCEVILDRQDYIKQIENILKNHNKFTKTWLQWISSFTMQNKYDKYIFLHKRNPSTR